MADDPIYPAKLLLESELLLDEKDELFFTCEQFFIPAYNIMEGGMSDEFLPLKNMTFYVFVGQMRI
ncbi:hypothetical protein NPIL_177021, partial [Nephila pilipes]